MIRLYCKNIPKNNRGGNMELQIYALSASLGCVFANCIMIAVEYIGALFGKEYEEENVKRKVITLIVAVFSTAILYAGMHIPVVSASAVGGIMQIAGCILAVITFGMQTFYVWL